jgi:hypothetical protein
MKNPTLLLKTRILFLFTLLCAAIASVQIVHAATITVMNTNDSGSGSLRQALADANDGDTINFDASATGTIALTSGELLVNDSITISGPGANILAVDGNHASRVFHINPDKTVTISGLSITNGAATGSFPAGYGGSIFNDRSTLTINNSTLSGNSASQSGGGIASFGDFGSATLTINNSTLSGNSASLGGGGIFNNGEHGSATLTINNSTLSSNSAPVSLGGGIFNDGRNSGSAALTIKNSTLSGNSASAAGGIDNEGDGGSATLTIGATILKTGADGENILNDSGPVTSSGYNISSDNGGGYLGATGDQINTNPMLDPNGLQDNGGPTLTIALQPGSPAIDKGENFSGSTTDQRGTGFARTYDDPAIANATGGDGTDIGAFEVQAANTVCPQPQGYWKNNPDAWPVNSLMLGSQSYTKVELLTILRTPVGTGKNADASLILADQLIAAKLNIANGADGTPVSSTITHADSVLSGFSGTLPFHVKPSTMTGQAMVTDAATLESFNKGMLTPGCSG